MSYQKGRESSTCDFSLEGLKKDKIKFPLVKFNRFIAPPLIMTHNSTLNPNYIMITSNIYKNQILLSDQSEVKKYVNLNALKRFYFEYSYGIICKGNASFIQKVFVQFYHKTSILNHVRFKCHFLS